MQFFDAINAKLNEAAFVPERWVEAIDTLTSFTTAASGGVGIYWPHQRGFTGTSKIEARTMEFWDQPAKLTRTLFNYLRTKNMIGNGFIPGSTDSFSDLPDIDERIALVDAHGVGPELATFVELFNGEIISLEVARRTGGEEFSLAFANSLKPVSDTFAISALFASRLYFEQAKGTVEVLATVGIPAALIGIGNRMLHCNSEFQQVADMFISLPKERVVLAGDETKRAEFNKALSEQSQTSTQIVLPPNLETPAAVINIIPLQGVARDIFASSYKMVLVTPVTNSQRVPEFGTIKQMFDLTPAEARLAIALASGLSLRDSAAKCSIQFGTARSYLLRVFIKTGTSRQGELIGLLKTIV
ncbi:helix-turn-helix transcriptional regulator [Phyllobacterium sp. TAF24]|uniref:helix-turn-helix transcriptional regulator n=1 Tax=Phyllobacterium sp. TAF24 TaxID=3233068 RepID=UPI003F945A3A